MFWNPNISTDKEPFSVLLKRGEWFDSSRGNRVVPYKIYYPVDHALASMPVVLWSHGFGGNKDGASFLSRFIAAHGYVVVHMTHAGTDSSLWEGKKGHPWDILRELKIPRAASIDRMKDIPFVLDQLPLWAKEHEDVGPYMDFSNIGMSGHSFGAMTTQVMAGMLFPDYDDHLISMKDHRFKAGILYSPVPIRHVVGERAEETYKPISLPLFYMTGTDDDSPIEGFGYKERLTVYETSQAAKKYLLILQGGDHMVYNGTRGKLESNPKRGRHEEIIKIGALAFWDMYLKNDEKAHDWLTKGGFADYIGADGTYEAQEK